MFMYKDPYHAKAQGGMISKKKALGQNTISRKPPAATKQEKERKKWEGNVTSHFSEVEEFDLSFS